MQLGGAIVSWALLAAAPLVGCAERGATPPATTQQRVQTLRVALESPGGELPFFVDVPTDVDQGVAQLRNGQERIDVAFSRDAAAGRLTLDFPHYDSTLTLDRDAAADGRWQGRWRRFSSEGVYEEMAASASPVETGDEAQRFHGRKTPTPSYAGVWRMTFEQDGPAKGVLEQTPDGRLAGTILTPTGDYRFLAGEVIEGELRLSVFDGAHAFLFHGALDRDDPDRMTGTFWSRMSWRDPFTARRLGPGEKFELPDPFSETSLTSGDGKLRLAALEQPRYQGKAVIVQLFGTWCPNCHDEAPVLVDLYRRRRAEGLEILSLAYEFGDDAARIDRQIQRYRQRYGIDWEIIWAGPSKKEEASRTLPDLSAVKAYPTTIFLNRDHSVRAIHTGFAGPATGEEHEQLLREFESLVDAIIASPAPASAGGG